jgi:chemotaxis protein methyltransferase CheR
MAALHITDYQVYYALLLTSPAVDNPPDFNPSPTQKPNPAHSEILKLIEGVAINETSFFRNKEHYRTLQEEELPKLIRRHTRDKHLRFWTAGCSTGQEPYSLAMCAHDTLRKLGESPSNWNIEILATDISGRVLKTARQGRYRSDEMRGLSPEQIELYFQPLSAPTVLTAPLDPAYIYIPGKIAAIRGRIQPSFEVNPEIRRLVKFEFFNLITPVLPQHLFQKLDLVLCENVTIYFAPKTTRTVIENIYKALDYGGFLFIGYSETLWQVSDSFKLINSHETFYYQKPFPQEDLSRHARHRALTGPFIPPAGTADQPQGAAKPLAERIAANRAGFPLKESTRQQLSLSEQSASNPLEKPEASARTKKPELLPAVPPIEQRSGKPGEEPDGRSLLAEGKLKMAAHEFEQALAYLERAVAASPRDDEVLCAMAELQLKLGEYEAALQLCRQVIQINRLSEAAHLMLAMIYHKEKRIEAAIQEYKTTIFINLECVIAYLRLGDIFRDNRQPREALREYRRALDVLRKKAPDEIIEDLSVGLLRQACEQNIARLNQRGFR